MITSSQKPAKRVARMTDRAFDLWLHGLLFLIVALALATAAVWPVKARIFPFVILIPTLLLIALSFILVRRNKQDEDSSSFLTELRLFIRLFSWIVGLYVAAMLVGFKIACFLFIFAYLRAMCRMTWLRSALLGALFTAIFWTIFELLLQSKLPGGLVVSG